MKNNDNENKRLTAESKAKLLAFAVAANEEKKPAYAETFRKDTRGIYGLLSFLFDDGSQWINTEGAGEYEPLLPDIAGYTALTEAAAYKNANMDIRQYIYSQLAEIQENIDDIEEDRAAGKYPEDVLNEDRNNLAYMQSVLFRIDKFLDTPDYAEYKQLQKRTQKELFFIALDEEKRKDFFDQITLDVLTGCFESRTPTDTERKRWDEPTTQEAKRLAYVARLTVSNAIRIYNYMTDTGHQLKETSKAAKNALAELKKSTPADISPLGLAAEELAKGKTPYVPMNTFTALDKLTQLNSTINKPTVLKTRNQAKIEADFAIRADGQLEIIVNNYEAQPKADGTTNAPAKREKPLLLDIKTSTAKLLDMLLMAITERNHFGSKDNNPQTLAEIQLDTYCDLVYGKHDRETKKNARKKVLRDIDVLHNTSFTYKDGDDKLNFYISGGTVSGVKNGRIFFTFSPLLIQKTLTSYQINVPLALFSLSERNANVYPLGKKLTSHRSIDANERRGTANIISVAAALEACPDIAKIEAVAKTDRAYTRRIIEPLEKALDTLKAGGVLDTWEFCGSKGRKLTDKEISDAITTTKQTHNIYIKYELKDYPKQEQLERMERKQERIDAKKKANYAKKKKKSPNIPDSIKKKKG